MKIEIIPFQSKTTSYYQSAWNLSIDGKLRATGFITENPDLSGFGEKFTIEVSLSESLFLSPDETSAVIKGLTEFLQFLENEVDKKS